MVSPAALLAAASPTPTPGQTLPVDPSRVTPGLLGTLSFLFLVGAAILLFRSLNKQLRRVPPEFPADGPNEPPTESG